jgi:WD40 repeat protein
MMAQREEDRLSNVRRYIMGWLTNGPISVSDVARLITEYIYEFYGTQLLTIPLSTQIYTMTVLPSGKLVTAPYFDSLLKVWDFANSECLPLTLSLGLPSAATLLLDVLLCGKLVSVSTDAMTRLWDTESGDLMRTFQCMPQCVAQLPNGNLVTGCLDVQIWDTVTGECVQTLTGHTGTVDTLVVLPCGKLVSGSADTVSGKCVQTLTQHTGAVHVMIMLPFGKLVSGSADHTMRVWENVNGMLTQTQILAHHTGDIVVMVGLPPIESSPSPDQRLASGSCDHTIKIWDMVTGTLIHTLASHNSYVTSLSVLPCGKLVSGSDGDATVKVWDTVKGELILTLDSDAYNACVLPDGKLVTNTNGFLSTMNIWG